MKVGGIIKICILAVLMLTLPGRLTQVRAAEPLSLSLDNAVERALENNLDLKINLIDLSAADYQAKRLWAEIFPSISLSASAGYKSDLFSGNGFVVNKGGESYSAGVGISLPLNAGTAYRVKNIRLAYQSKLLDYEDARNLLEIQVTKDFFGLIADRENLNSLEENLKLANQQLEKDRRAFAGGLVNELTVTQSRLAMENSRYSLSAARSDYANRLMEFLALLGIERNTGTVLEGQMRLVRFDIDEEALIGQYLPGRPDIIRSRQTIERLENEEKAAALSNRSPSLTLRANWDAGAFDPFADDLGGSVGISIPVDPWIPGTKGAQVVRNAKLAIEKAKLELRLRENAAITEIRSLAAQLRNSWERIEIARLSLQVAERTYELTEEGFNNGIIESLKLEDARNKLSNAHQQLLTSELDCQFQLLDFSAALNANWKELINDK